MNTSHSFKIFRNVFHALVALTMLFSQFGWAGSLASAAPIKVGLITDIGGVDDQSFNQMAYQGLLQAESDLGIVKTVYESTSSDDYVTLLQQCVTDGNELCISVGFLMGVATANAARANPSIKYAIVDYSYPDCWEGATEGVDCGSFTDIPNVRGLTFASKQVGYLAGALAGKMTVSDVIGTVGGMQISSVTSFIEGYRNGAQCANPDVDVLINYTNDFGNPDLGAERAQLLMLQGADVIFNVAGPTGNGAILYAAQNGAWAIGVDNDQYLTVFENGGVAGSDRLLTSAMKRVDTAVYETISDVVAGIFTSGTVIYDLAGDGVGMAPYHETDGVIPTATKDYVDTVKAGIIAGTINMDETCRRSKVVRLWYAYGQGGGEEDALMQVIANAEAADPDLDIVPIWRSFNNYYSDYETAVNAGMGPDMFVGPNDNLGNEMRAGQLLNLDSYLAGNLTNVTQTAIDGMKVDDSLYGVPESAKAVALYYNTSTVPTPPTTTAGLLTMLQGGKKLAVPSGAVYFLYGFWHAFGGQLMDGTGYCTADQGGFTDAMQYFLDLQTAGASLLNPDDALNSFTSGAVDMYINGPWVLADLETAMGSNLGVVVLPAGPSGIATPMNGIDGFYVNPNSPHPADDVEAALLVVNQTNSQIFTDTGGHIPVRTDVSSTDPLNNAFALASAQGEPRPQNEQLNNYWGPFQEMFDNVLGGSASPAEGVMTACRKMNQANGFITRTYYLKASAAEEWVHAYGWADGTELTLTIDNYPGHTFNATMGQAPWDPTSPDIVGVFDPISGYDLLAGDVLTVSGAGHTKTYTVPADMTQVRWFIGLGTGGDPSQLQTEFSVVDDYNISQANIELIVDVEPRDTVTDTLTTQIAAGNAPDIVGPVGWAGSHSFQGQWKDLTTISAWSVFNTSQFTPSMLDMYDIPGEGQVGLPIDEFPSAIYYNPALFDAAGLNYPPAHYGDQYQMPDLSMVNWNWDTLAQVAKLLTQDNAGKNSTQTGFDPNAIVQYGFSFGWESNPNYWGSFWKAGQILQGVPGAYLAVIPNDWKTAWEWVYNGMWGNQPFIPNGQASGNLAGGNVFASGKVAMLDNPSWYLCCVGDLTGAGGTFQFGAMPTYNGAVGGRIDADSFRILKDSAHPDQAFDALAYLVTTGVDKLVVGTADTPAAYTGVPAITSKQDSFWNSQADRFPFVTTDSWNILKAGLNYPDLPSAEAYMPHFTDAWNRIQSFGDTLSNNPSFSLTIQETILEADLTAIFNGEPLPLHPYIQANPVGHWMHGYGWPIDTPIHVTITRPGSTDTWQADALMEQAPWNPGDPNDILANFNLWNPRWDLQPGDAITMTDGSTPAIMTVWTFGATASDAELNTVSGPADAAYGLVHVWVNDQNWDQWVPVVSGGWTADFSPNDLTPGTYGGAFQPDGYGNQVQADWHTPRPWIQAGVTNRYVDAHEWPLHAHLTMTINGDLLHPYTADVENVNSGDLFDTYATFNNISLQGGDDIHITNGTTEKDYTVTALQVLSADPGTNTVSGAADDGAQVQVCVNITNDCIQRWATPSGGTWSVDYSSTSDPNDSRTHTLVAGDNGWAAQYNDFGDRTWVDWRILNPYIEAAPYSDWIHAREWPDGTPVTLTIDDPSNGVGVDYTEGGTMGPAPWNPGDPNDIVADFRWPDQFAPGPGYKITMTGNLDGIPITKTLIVADLRVLSADAATDIVSGVATPGATNVEVCFNQPGTCNTRYPEVDDISGEWSVDYTAENMQPGDNGWVAEYDNDNDRTWYDWRVPNPNFHVRANEDRVEAYEWPLGNYVTLTVDNPGTPSNPDYASSPIIVGVANWDPNQTYAEFNLRDIFDIQPGFVVRMTDTFTTKTMTVSVLSFTGVDIDTDVVAGIASPNVRVNIWACDWSGCYNRHATSDGAGIWSVDFFNLGSEGNEQIRFNIVNGTWIDSEELDPLDNNGDRTRYGINVSLPYIEASVNSHWVHARGNWPDGTLITMTIDKPPLGSVDYGPVTATFGQNPGNPGDPNDRLADFDLGSYELQAYQVITMTGGGITKTYTIQPLQVTGYNLVTDTISGSGFFDHQLQVCVNNMSGNCSRHISVGPGYTWMADYGNPSPTRPDEQDTTDLVPGSNGWVADYEDDGDQTWFDWSVPPTFSDVPFDYSVTYGGVTYYLHNYIQALYAAGYTSGCSTNPLSYCPNNTLTRVEAAVFMLRGLLGTSYAPPTNPAGYVFTDNWSSPTVNWGRPWAEGMWDEGLTAGCQTSPRLFCPATAFTRAEASVFGLRIENGASYTPPAATHIFADDWSSPTFSWAEAWAEQAYLHGLLPACGESGGKPLFCPGDLVTRAWAAYLVVEAKDLPVTP